MIIGRDEFIGVPLREIPRNFFPGGFSGIVFNNSGAVCFSGSPFGGRRIIWHDNGCLYAQKTADQGNGLGMIPRRMGDDTPLAVFFGKLGHGVVSTSEFKCTDPLIILTFKIDGCADPLVKGARGHNRGDMGLTAEPLFCRLNAAKHRVCIFGHNLAAVFH